MTSHEAGHRNRSSGIGRTIALLRILLFLSFSLVVILPSLAEEPEYTILAEDAAGPWGQADGTGCGNDLVTAAFAASGVKITLKTMPYVRAKVEVLRGRALGCFGMSRDPSLEGKIVFPNESIYVSRGVLFALKSKGIRLHEFKDLPRESLVGIVRDYEYPQEFSSLVQNGKVTPYSTNSEDLSLRMLGAGRLDFVLCMVDALKSSEFLLKEAQVSDLVEPVLSTQPQPTTIGFAADNPQAAPAIKAFDQGMALIKANGVYAEIVKKWTVHP